MNFAVVTDIHFGPVTYWRGIQRKMGNLALRLTREFVQEMNNVVHPDNVLQLGDLIQDMSLNTDATNFLRGVSILRELDAPLFHAIGNHDQAFLPLSLVGRMLEQEQNFYSFDFKGFHFVCLLSRLQSTEKIEAEIDED